MVYTKISCFVTCQAIIECVSLHFLCLSLAHTHGQTVSFIQQIMSCKFCYWGISAARGVETGTNGSRLRDYLHLFYVRFLISITKIRRAIARITNGYQINIGGRKKLNNPDYMNWRINISFLVCPYGLWLVHFHTPTTVKEHLSYVGVRARSRNFSDLSFFMFLPALWLKYNNDFILPNINLILTVLASNTKLGRLVKVVP